jgi:hypothetical protein
VEAARRREIRQVAAAVGVPDAQRDPDRLTLERVPQIGSAPRTLDKTVRRLSRVEALRRSGVIELHEAQACEWFAENRALAWDTVRVTGNYDGPSGGGAASAPDYLAARNIEIAHARDDYRYAIGFIPAHFLPLFEAVVCENVTIAAVAETAFTSLKRSQAEEKTRLALKLCANLLHGGVSSRLPIC